jgi:CheY-like chemotaxis protein
MTSGLRILLADDNCDSVQMLAAVLRYQGHDVRVANDGESALEAGTEFHPQAGILDIGMPRMTGHELARRIRQEPWGQDILLIALSGWGASKDKKLARDAGFDHHVSKPADVQTLTDLLRNCLRTH